MTPGINHNLILSGDDMNIKGQDLNSLLDLLHSFAFQETEQVAPPRRTPRSQASSQQISHHSKGCSRQPTEMQREDDLDFGLVDSLTLIDCKKLIIDISGETEEEQSFKENEITDNHVHLAERKSSFELRKRKRTGVRRGHSDQQQATSTTFTTFTVPTKR